MRCIPQFRYSRYLSKINKFNLLFNWLLRMFWEMRLAFWLDITIKHVKVNGLLRLLLLIFIDDCQSSISEVFKLTTSSKNIIWKKFLCWSSRIAGLILRIFVKRVFWRLWRMFLLEWWIRRLTLTHIRADHWLKCIKFYKFLVWRFLTWIDRIGYLAYFNFWLKSGFYSWCRHLWIIRKKVNVFIS